MHILSTIKIITKSKEAVRISRTGGRTCSSDIVRVGSRRGRGWQTVWVFVYTIKPWQGACEGEAGRFSTKCLICCRVKISSLKAYEVALRRMVLCYLLASCNYSVWTLLQRAFRDEKGRERSGGRERMEWEKMERENIFTTMWPEMVLCVREVDLVSSLLLKYGYQHENSNMQRAQIDLNKLEIIGEEKLVTLGLNCSGFTIIAFLRH